MATADFPMKHLKGPWLNEKGDSKGLLHPQDNVIYNDSNLLAFVWVDQNQRHFLSTGSKLMLVSPFKRSPPMQWQRWLTLKHCCQSALSCIVRTAAMWTNAMGLVKLTSKLRRRF